MRHNLYEHNDELSEKEFEILRELYLWFHHPDESRFEIKNLQEYFLPEFPTLNILEVMDLWQHFSYSMDAKWLSTSNLIYEDFSTLCSDYYTSASKLLNEWKNSRNHKYTPEQLICFKINRGR